MKKTYLILVLLSVSSYTLAQRDSTATQGEVITGEIVIEKDKKITFPKADKLYKQATSRGFDSERLTFRFDVIEPSFDWPPYKSDVPFKKTSQPYPSAKYPNYVKLGYGNFNSPLVEVGVFQKLGSFNTSSKISFERFGNGPVNGSNSGSSLGTIDIAATHKKESLEITPSISYSGQKYRLYGNTDRINSGFNSEKADEILWNDFNIGLAFKGKAGEAKYSITPVFNGSNQKLVDGNTINKETTLGANGELNFKLNEHFSTGLQLQGLTGDYDGGLAYDRSLFIANPNVTYLSDDIKLKAGFNIASSKSGQSKTSGFYPDVRGEWYFSKDWTVYGSLSGGVKWNGLNDLLNQNEFLDDSLAVLNTETKLEFGGGIKGVLVKNMILDANVLISNLDQLPIFVPSLSDSSRYTVTYDNGTINRFRLNTSLTYTPTNVSTYGARLELNSYSVESLERAWHLPTYVFEAFTSHNINEKMIASVAVLAMGGLKAPANVNFGIANLDSFLDANIGLKYLITKRASAFVDVNNILGNEYERYLGYPVRGLSFKIGGQYRF